MKRTPEVLRDNAPRFKERSDAISALDAAVEACAALCEQEAARLPARPLSDIQDELNAQALKLRAFKSGSLVIDKIPEGSRVRSATEILRLHASRLADIPEILAILNEVIEQCAEFCDAEADTFRESAESYESDDDFAEAKLHFKLHDHLKGIAKEMRILKHTGDARD
jgi:hypothetical protein